MGSEITLVQSITLAVAMFGAVLTEAPTRPWWRKKRRWVVVVVLVVIGTPFAVYLYDQHDTRGEAARLAVLLRTAPRIDIEGGLMDRHAVEDLATLLEGAPRVDRVYYRYALEAISIYPYRSSLDREPAARVSVAYNGLIRFYRPGDDWGMYLVFADGREIFRRLGGGDTDDYWVDDRRAENTGP